MEKFAQGHTANQKLTQASHPELQISSPVLTDPCWFSSWTLSHTSAQLAKIHLLLTHILFSSGSEMLYLSQPWAEAKLSLSSCGLLVQHNQTTGLIILDLSAVSPKSSTQLNSTMIVLQSLESYPWEVLLLFSKTKSRPTGRSQEVYLL